MAGKSENAYMQTLKHRGQEYVPFEYRYYRDGAELDARKVWPKVLKKHDQIHRPPPPKIMPDEDEELE